MKKGNTIPTADWSVIGNRAPWEHVTSMELSKVLGVHLQTVNNWRIRQRMPDPTPNNRKLKGNKNYFRIGSIRAWLENCSEKDIIREWIMKDMNSWDITDEQICYLLQQLYKVDPAIFTLAPINANS